MIETRGLTRHFGATAAVDALTWSLPSFGVVGLLGRSGSGKTTLLRMLAGLLSPTAGSATVRGIDVQDDPRSVRSAVGWLPDAPPGWHVLTVGEILSTLAALRRVPGSDRAARIGEVLAAVGLSGVEGRRLGALSRGYRQRVGIAGALLHRPPVLLLDEPTTGLDAAQRIVVHEHLERIGRERLVVWSTHDLDEVAPLCERFLVLDRGRSVAQGSLEDLAAAAGLVPGLILQATGDLQRLAPRLAAAFGSAAPMDGAIHLPAGADVPTAVALASEAGCHVHAVVPRAPGLRDVFLALGDRP